MGFEYFYGDEAEQFSFYRIPKLLMTSPRFKKLSDSAKLLYGLMLDRMGLSVRNGWFDDKNRAYIYFTVNEIMSIMNCATEKATKIVAELDSAKGVGLIERIKQGQGKPAIIYLKRFVDTDEQSTLKIEKQEIYTEENKDFEKRNQGILKNEKQGFGKSKCNNTDINNTEMSNINSIHQDVEKKERWIDRYTQTINEIKEQIDYGYLISTNEKEIVDEVVNIMADVMTVYRPKYKIEGVPVDSDAVINNFKKVTADKLEICLLAYSRIRKRILNTKSYWITVLYNIPLTSHLALQNMVNNDMYLENRRE